MTVFYHNAFGQAKACNVRTNFKEKENDVNYGESFLGQRNKTLILYKERLEQMAPRFLN